MSLRSFAGVVLFFASFACSGAAVFGQGVVVNPGGDARQFTANPMGQWLNWLIYPQIQSELDLLSDQKIAIDKVRMDMTGRMQEAYKELKDVDPSERNKKYQEIYVKLGAETDKRVEEILLPHQIKRIRQIALQMRLGASGGFGYGSAAALNQEDIAKELGVTPEQVETLKKREVEIRQELQEKTREFYKKMNDEAREKLMSVLTDEQRQKLKALEGDRFEWKYLPPAQPVGGQGGQAKPADSEKK